MSQPQKKRRGDDKSRHHIDRLEERLPESCKKTVNTHINTIYVGSVIRIYDPSGKSQGQLATAHWITTNGLFVTLHDEGTSNFVNLKYKSWVVDHGFVKPGAFKLFSRHGTNDIEEKQRSHTINEKKKRVAKSL